jgi:hypothetical protein
MKRNRVSSVAVWPLAVLLAAVSLGGLLLPSAYARETPAWIAQAKGQDWFDVLVIVPWLVACGVMLRERPTYRWRVLLAGTYAYCVYEMLIYAFAVHFNALFLLYCATLGVSTFGLISALSELARERHAVDRRAAWLGGGFLVAVGGLFALLWLADIVPALLHGTPSRDLADTGLYTNPVHVIDLSFVLPVHVIVGIALWHRHRIGEIYGPVVLAFGVAMAASIAGMQIAIAAMGGALALPVTITLLVVAGASGAILARMLFPPHVPAVTAIHAV